MSDNNDLYYYHKYLKYRHKYKQKYKQKHDILDRIDRIDRHNSQEPHSGLLQTGGMMGMAMGMEGMGMGMGMGMEGEGQAQGQGQSSPLNKDGYASMTEKCLDKPRAVAEEDFYRQACLLNCQQDCDLRSRRCITHRMSKSDVDQINQVKQHGVSTSGSGSGSGGMGGMGGMGMGMGMGMM